MGSNIQRPLQYTPFTNFHPIVPTLGGNTSNTVLLLPEVFTTLLPTKLLTICIELSPWKLITAVVRKLPIVQLVLHTVR